MPVSALLLAATVAAAACGGAGSPTPSPAASKSGSTTQAPGVTAQPEGSGPAVGGTRPACDLLTDAEIEDVTGFTVESKKGGRGDVAYQNSCAWLFADNSWTLVLGIQAPGGASEYDLMLEYEGGTPVDGLGDRAFTGEVSDSLFALRGDTLVNLQFVAVDEAADVERRLVERVLANL